MKGTTLGILPILFYDAHCLYWILHSHWENMLWICHLASLFIGFGMLFATPRLIAIGMLWVSLGNAFWLLYVFTGGELMITSLLTHTGSLFVGLVGVYRFGFPARSSGYAAIGLVFMNLVCRFTPPSENVNLAHRVADGYESTFTSYPLYLLMLLCGSILGFLALEWIFRKLAASARSATPVS